MRYLFAMLFILGWLSLPPSLAQPLVELARPGPWAGISGLMAYHGKLYFVNSQIFVNHNAADIYSYDLNGPQAGGRAGPRAGGRAGPSGGGRAGPQAGGRAGPQAGGRAGPQAGGRAGPQAAAGLALRRAAGLALRRAAGRTTERFALSTDYSLRIPAPRRSLTA
ncbi:MAG: hypothetical protein ETSY2_17120 [Candidatus Entotheonella gemina]|uniref:Uncharacterized protein n=2 Tax=Candidatus Entotheonella TaxID=93171 RepID=W4M8A8_9BACT|nr:MAG: hypothetical protein ETSY2_17120 [Candidatus Entotheonella gemina]